jgi:thiol-disulfide isomerase/thioredoxin
MKNFIKKDYETVLASERPSLIFFTSDSCHLCIGLKPIVKKLEKKYLQSIDFYFCDVKKEPFLKNHMLKDAGVPTGFIISNGRLFKINDPKEPSPESWYTNEYLDGLIGVIIG